MIKRKIMEQLKEKFEEVGKEITSAITSGELELEFKKCDILSDNTLYNVHFKVKDFDLYVYVYRETINITAFEFTLEQINILHDKLWNIGKEMAKLRLIERLEAFKAEM